MTYEQRLENKNFPVRKGSKFDIMHELCEAERDIELAIKYKGKEISKYL